MLGPRLRIAKSAPSTGADFPIFSNSRESGGMADALDLGSSAARRGGSSPPSRTIAKPNAQSVNLKSGAKPVNAPLLSIRRASVRRLQNRGGVLILSSDNEV